jgi:alanine racemase
MEIKTQNKYAWVELYKSHFDHNVRVFYEKLLPSTKIAMVVKSNAYGHGLSQMGKLCQTNPYIHSLCTINEQEALQLRQAGITKPILVMGYIQDYKAAVQADCEIAVYDESQLREIIAICKAYKLIAKLHIKIDTGLSRLGFLPETIGLLMEYLYQSPHIEIKGVMSHFADPYSKEYTSYQIDQFNKALTLGNFSSKATRHICNTIGAFLYPHAHLDMVRIGIGLYGYLPASPLQPLLPIATLKAPILQIKTIPANTFVGYERLAATAQPTRIGIIPFGYHEGMDRDSAQHNYVCMNGYKAPLLGRVSMNLSTIDLTNVPEKALTNEVTILGCPVLHDKITHDHYYPSIYEQLVRLDPEIEKSIFVSETIAEHHKKRLGLLEDPKKLEMSAVLD